MEQHLHSPQNAEADCPLLVEVGVESDHTPTGGHEFHSGGLEWVVWGKAEDEVEESPLVGGVKRTSDESMKLKREMVKL